MLHDTSAEQVWLGDWKSRHLERIRAGGAPSVLEFLSNHAGEPYAKLCKRLGGHVAPIQLRILQFEEAAANGAVVEAAKDLLVRTLNTQLKRGWASGGRYRQNRIRARADFIHELRRFLGPESVQRAERVLDNLENLQPPCDWLPRSAVDPLIEKAFAIGWPPNEPNAQLPRAGEYHD